MPKCTDETSESGRLGRRVVKAEFDGGDIVSDGGVLLLEQVDERLGLTRAASRAFGDDRRCSSNKGSSLAPLAPAQVVSVERGGAAPQDRILAWCGADPRGLVATAPCRPSLRLLTNGGVLPFARGADSL